MTNSSNRAPVSPDNSNQITVMVWNRNQPNAGILVPKGMHPLIDQVDIYRGTYSLLKNLLKSLSDPEDPYIRSLSATILNALQDRDGELEGPTVEVLNEKEPDP